VFREAVLLTVGLHIFGTAAWAGPEGATVVHGTATFQQSGSYTAIQASDKAIINYRSFDVARPETVQFLQPGASASVLNRILSANPTTIDGTILANGRVFFVNPAGVVFGESAQVNVAQLVASALDIRNADFLNGRYDFKGGDGSVVNKGQISAERAYLIGKQVANLGKIDCPTGHVVMAAGDRVFLGEPGTDLLVEMDEPALPGQAAPLEGAAIRNEGSVEAAGGSIMLAAAGDIYAHAISNVGRLSAARADGDAGTVKLVAPAGTVNNTGSIEAWSESGAGGQVQMLGERVGLFGFGRIDASGAAGGGTVLVGGDYRGQGEVPTASRTSVGADASIRADATRDGDGGKIIVWSDEVTKFNGHASATGAGNGKGGLIEVSGKQDLSFAGTVTLGAPAGHGGTLLLDPDLITITDGGENLSPQGDLAFGDAPYPATISEVTLENTAAGSNTEIVLEATNDIVMNDLTDNALTLSPGVSLVLRTRNNPAFEENAYGGITMSSGDSIVASGGGSLTLQAGHNGTGFVANSAAHVDAGSLVTDGGSVTVQATGNVSVQNVTTAGVANAAGGGVILEAGVGTASYSLGVWGTIDTSGGPDADTSGANPAGSVTLSAGDVYLQGDIIAVGGSDNGGDAPGGAGGAVTVGAPGGIYMPGSNISASGGSGSLDGNGGNVTFNGPLFLEGDVTVTAGRGDVTFQYSVNAVYGEGGLMPANLVVNSAGTTRFGSPVGQEYPLTSITTDAPGTTQINADITTGDVVLVPPPATQTYNDPVLLTNDVTLTDLGTTGIFLNGTVDSAAAANYALTITADVGDAVFGGAVGSDALGALSNDAGLGAIIVTSGGSTQINGGSVRSIASQVYHSPVTLNSPAVLTGSDVTFDSTIAAGASSLTITGDAITLGSGVSGTGVLTLQPATPTRTIYVGYDDQGGFSLDNMELGYLQNGFNMINIGRLDGQHNLYIYQTTFQDPVTFRSPVPGGGIYVMGKITGINDASITLMGAGATTVLYDGIETPGQDIVINDSVRLADNTDITLSTGAGGGNISITGPVNGTAGAEDMGDESLTLTAGTGTITVGDIFGASGAASGNGLTTVSVTNSGPATFGQIDITGALNATTGAGTFSDDVRVGSASLQGTSFDFAGSVTTTGTINVTATGAVAFGGAVTLGGDLTTTATGNVTFGATLDDDGNPQTSSDVAVNSAGATRFGGAVGGVQPIDSLSTNTTGTTELGANVTTQGAQVYQNPLVLANNVILTDLGTTSILFPNTVNDNGAGPWDLTVITTNGTAEIRFGGAVGGSQPLDQITITNAGPVHLSATLNLDGAFLQNGAGPVYLNDSIATTGDPITFQRAVASVGDVVLNTGTGANGHVTFQDALTLGGDLTITAGNGNVIFEGSIDNLSYPSTGTSYDLVVNSGGTTRFNGAVGGTERIGSITTDAAGTTEIGASINTGEWVIAPGPVGTQIYNDPVVLTNNVTLTDRGTTGIFFNNTVNGNGQSPWNLRVETTDAAAQVLFNGAVTLGGGLWVQTAGGNVMFQGTVDGAEGATGSDLAVYSAGTTRFNAAVGGVHPVGQVYTDAAGMTQINANITTGGTQLLATQVYDDPVVLTNSATLTDTGMDGITFNNTVNGNGLGPWDLTVVTTDPAADIRFNGDVSLDGGIAATAAGDIYANSLSSARNNIELRSTGGNLNLYGAVNADRDAAGNGGGVSLIAGSGMVQSGDGILGVIITGYSDGVRGVALPYNESARAAIRIESSRPLDLDNSGALIARGTYGGTSIEFIPQVDENPGEWARDWPADGSTFYRSSVDDRTAVGFSTEGYYGGVPIDIAVYVRSSASDVTIASPVTVPAGATVVLDAYDTLRFGATFVADSAFPDTSRLELVSRVTTSLATEVDRGRFPYPVSYSGMAGHVEENQGPEGFGGYSSVLRGGANAQFLATMEHWYSYQRPPDFDIYGTKYTDYDGDGSIGEGDTGLSGVTIFIDMDGSGTLTEGDLTTTTGEGGAWAFHALDSTYNGRLVYEVLPDGYAQTLGQVGYTIDGTGGYQGGLDFANFKLFNISGTKYTDNNGDGVIDAGDTGLAGMTVFIDMDNSRTLTAGDRTSTTGEDGAWSFLNLDFTYSGRSVFEVVPNGYEQTLGHEGFAILGTSGYDQIGLVFANHLLPLPPEETPLPPPLPPIVVPVVVPPIPTYPIERLTWIPQAEIIVGPIQPPHPECLDVKDEDIEVLRKCQVACDLFSTDVALNIVAEDIVTLNQRLKAQVQQVLPGLDNLSQKWPRVRPSDMPAIEQALRQDQALNSWLQDGVEFVKLLRTKLGRTTNDSVERFLLEYLANATDEPVLDFVQAYLKSQLASAAETGKPVASIGR
jgi:filamentous hemagglutinin family protein